MVVSYLKQHRNILVAQIRLFSRVCKVEIVHYLAVTLKLGVNHVSTAQGVNHVSIAKIVEEDKLVTIEEAFLCIKDEDLDRSLRSAYIDFIISTLVDVNVEESGTRIENIWHTFVSLTRTHSTLSQIL